MKLVKLKKGDKVKPKQDHECLDVTKKDVGIVDEIQGTDTCVQFEHKRGTVIFQRDELVKQRKAR